VLFFAEHQCGQKTCPACNQGRLFIYKNLDKNVLYLHCEECERGYYDPQHIDVGNSFLTLLFDFDSVEATIEDLKENNWQDLPINGVYE